jgi:hypothetical protein
MYTTYNKMLEKKNTPSDASSNQTPWTARASTGSDCPPGMDSSSVAELVRSTNHLPMGHYAGIAKRVPMLTTHHSRRTRPVPDCEKRRSG